MDTIKLVEDYTKESYKKAICEACDDIKNRLDDILCDFEKQVRNISITIKVGVGEVSVLNIVKEVAVQGDDKE